jgi:hypothetical protein
MQSVESPVDKVMLEQMKHGFTIISSTYYEFPHIRGRTEF